NTIALARQCHGFLRGRGLLAARQHFDGANPLQPLFESGPVGARLGGLDRGVEQEIDARLHLDFGNHERLVLYAASAALVSRSISVMPNCPEPIARPTTPVTKMRTSLGSAMRA